MRNFRHAVLSAVLLLVPLVAPAQGTGSPARLPGTALFVENRGQWETTARYLFRAPTLDLWVTDRGMIYDVRGGEGRQAVALRFVGADGVRPVGLDRAEGTFNYFHGSDPGGWVTGVSGYERLRSDGVYDGIDLLFRVENGTPRYDIIVGPGADPGAVTMRIDGADRVIEEGGGTLKIVTEHGTISHAGLFAYQESGSGREAVPCRFRVGDHGEVGFVVGEYDRGRPLVVDPLIFSTFISGDSFFDGIAVGPDNSTYIAGTTYGAVFPLVPGAYVIDSTLAGFTDVFVARLKADGSGMIYMTYLGGNEQDWGSSIDVDPQGNAYITGMTESNDYPVTGGSYDQISESQDAYVTKLNPTGTELVYSTYLGGSKAERGQGITVDRAGNAYVVGYTWSDKFPTTAGAYDVSFNGEADGFVVKLNTAGSRLLYSTLIGGSGAEEVVDIAVDAEGRAYVTGVTDATEGVGFPTTPGAFDPSHNGGADAFVAVLNPPGNGLISSTLLGGAGNETGVGIALDSSGNVYVTGWSTWDAAAAFPTTPGAYDEGANGEEDCFVVKLRAGSPTLGYSTLIGGPGRDYALDIAVDQVGNSYVTGFTYSLPFPTTPDALRTAQLHDTGDVFIFKLDPTGRNLRYSTLYGGRSQDVGAAIALDRNGAVCVSGYTYSSDFPTTPGVFDGSNNDGTDAFVLKLDIPVSPAVLLASPLGGEGFCAGSAQIVRWRSAALNRVKIELSSDGGGSYPTVLATGVPAGAGEWSWEIPKDIPSLSTYRIRVSGVNNGDVIDESWADFMIRTIPSIVSQSRSVDTVCAGNPLELRASVVGVGNSYIWRRNRAPLPGRTDSVLRIPSTSLGDSGTYDAIVSNSCGPADTSAPMRIVIVPETAVTLDRTSIGVCIGDTIRVGTVSGGGNPRYVWRHKGVVIPGATAATLELPARDASDTGTYDVIVTGLCGPPDTSAPVRVRLMKEPVITSELPARLVARPGSKVVLTISVTGDVEKFRWLKNGTEIPGAVKPTLEIDPVTGQDSGFYSVVVTGPCGVVTGEPSRLDIEGGQTAVPDASERYIGLARLVSIPHPARGTARIVVEVPAGLRPGAGAGLQLFDANGRLAADLTESFERNEYREATFEADALPSGVYTCRLQRRGVEIPLGAIVVVR